MNLKERLTELKKLVPVIPEKKKELPKQKTRWKDILTSFNHF